MTLARMFVAAAALASIASLRTTATTTADIALRYDTALIADGFPSPLATLTVNGQRASFLVDTGAGVHTFAKWFVEAAALHVERTNRTTTGSTGQENRVDVVSNVKSTLDRGAPLLVPQAIVVDFPQLFEQHRIGGLLSPQLLAGAGEEAVLDLVIPRLTFRRALSSDRGESATTVCTNRESPFRNRLYAAAVALDGTRASMLIDTGATGTIVSTNSAAGRGLEGRSMPGGQTHGVGGGVEQTRRVPTVSLARGGTTVTLDIALGTATNSCGPDGLLGMDALKQCVVALGPSAASLSCPRRGAGL